MLTSRHKKAPESFDSEALDHDYYIWVKNGNLRKLKRGIYLNLNKVYSGGDITSGPMKASVEPEIESFADRLILSSILIKFC